MHLLVGAYLGYSAPKKTTPDTDRADDQADNERPAWLQGMGSFAAPQEALEATTPEARLQAFERLFFGDLKDVEQLRRP